MIPDRVTQREDWKKREEAISSIDELMERFDIGVWDLKKWDEHECPRD